MTAVAWLGPVSPALQVPDATLPGIAARAVTCKGDGSPSCAQIAESWTDGSGRKLPNALRQLGLTEADLPLYLGAFSAGGSAVKRLLLDSRDRAPVSAVHLADATYTDWAKPGQPLPPEGFVRFALDALAGNKLFVATASSSPNGSLPSGSQTLASMKAEIELRSGAPLVEGGTLPGLPVQPERLWRSPGGTVILADYAGRISHGDHANKLAGPVWVHLVQPFAAGGVLPPSPNGGGAPPAPPPPVVGSPDGGLGGVVAAALAGFVAGYLATAWWMRRRA